MNLFTYGTLMDPEIMTQVSGSDFQSQQATLPEYLCKKIRGEVYPAIIRHRGSSVDGLLYFDIPPEIFAKLDRFEGPLYVRTAVNLLDANGEPVRAQTYVLKASAVGYLSDEDWSFEQFIADHKPNFQADHQEYLDFD